MHMCVCVCIYIYIERERDIKIGYKLIITLLGALFLLYLLIRINSYLPLAVSSQILHCRYKCERFKQLFFS